jgi:hypothetical protein
LAAANPHELSYKKFVFTHHVDDDNDEMLLLLQAWFCCCLKIEVVLCGAAVGWLLGHNLLDFRKVHALLLSLHTSLCKFMISYNAASVVATDGTYISLPIGVIGLASSAKHLLLTSNRALELDTMRR